MCRCRFNEIWVHAEHLRNFHYERTEGIRIDCGRYRQPLIFLQLLLKLLNINVSRSRQFLECT